MMAEASRVRFFWMRSRSAFGRLQFVPTAGFDSSPRQAEYDARSSPYSDQQGCLWNMVYEFLVMYLSTSIPITVQSRAFRPIRTGTGNFDGGITRASGSDDRTLVSADSFRRFSSERRHIVNLTIGSKHPNTARSCNAGNSLRRPTLVICFSTASVLSRAS